MQQHTYAPLPAGDAPASSPPPRRQRPSTRTLALAAATLIVVLLASLHEPTRQRVTSTAASLWPAGRVDERARMEAQYKEMLADVVMDSSRPPDRWSEYLVAGEQYLVTNFFGGQSELANSSCFPLSPARMLRLCSRSESALSQALRPLCRARARRGRVTVRFRRSVLLAHSARLMFLLAPARPSLPFTFLGTPIDPSTPCMTCPASTT